MELNSKKSQSSNWHSNIVNHFKKSSKIDKEKEATKVMEGKLKISQSSKIHSNMLSFIITKLSFKNENNISNETTRLKVDDKKLSKTENFAIETKDVNETKTIHLNDNFTEQMSNLNLNDAVTNSKKSKLQKCNNKLSFDKKDFGNCENAFCFDKNIKVEESEDESYIASNNLRTTLFNTEVKIENGDKLVKTDSDDQNTLPGKGIVERAPEKTHKNISTHRINPLQRKDFQGRISVYDTIAEADKKINSLIENFRQQEYYKVSEEIERAIIMEKSKSMSFGVESNVLLNENNQGTEVQCNNFEGVLNTSNSSYLSNCSDEDFIEADEELRKRVSTTPESECSSHSFQLKDLSSVNESVEDFFYGLQNYINHHFQCDSFASNLLPNSMHYSELNQTASKKFWYLSKNGYLNTIASKDQQTCHYELKTMARNRLFNSRSFSKDKCHAIYLDMYSKIRAGEFGTIKKEVIHNLKQTGAKKYRRTNLHAAVMDGKLEEAFCIIELHKLYHREITFHINIRDNKGMTVLDRAKENKSSIANDLNVLLIKYLEENNAQHSIHHMIPINTPGT